MGRDGKEKIRRKWQLDSPLQDRAIMASIVLCVFAAVMAAAGGYLTETGSEDSVPVIVDIIEETSAAKAQTAARGGAKDDVEIIDDVVEAVTSVIGGGEADGETASAATLTDIASTEIAAETERADGEGLININTATAKELESLYGIGEKLADAIIEYREEQPFETIEDIMKVKGIGAGKFDKIKDSITC